MTGSYLLYNQLHYNGLMTDWGLCNTLISLLWILRGRSTPAKTVAHCISVTSTLLFEKFRMTPKADKFYYSLLFIHPNQQKITLDVALHIAIIFSF